MGNESRFILRSFSRRLAGLRGQNYRSAAGTGCSTYPARKGFTLLELLIVVAIMAIVAGSVIMVLGETEEQAKGHVVQSEISELKTALLRFRKDTGFFPKRGPFGLVANGGQLDPNNTNHWPDFLSTQTAIERTDWFLSPANHYQLFALTYIDPVNQGPLAGTLPLHPLRSFNPDTARGWNGPYIGRAGNGFLRIGNGLGRNGSGSPIAGNAIDDVVGVADPFIHLPDGPTGHLAWRDAPSTFVGSEAHIRWGRPYLLFDIGDPSSARLMSMGPNGNYESSGGDDVLLFLLK